MRRSSACTLFGSGLGLLVAGLALAPRSAEASSCLPTVESLSPADGEALPVNARPLAEVSCGGDLGGWEVEIDGEPGALFLQSPGFGYGMLTTIGIDPAPPEGAQVEIWGCSEGCWDTSAEPDVLRSYVVGPRDHDAPAAPELLELSHADELVTRWDPVTGEEEQVAVRRWIVRFTPPELLEPEAWEIEVGPRQSSTPAKTARIMQGIEDEVVLVRESADAGREVCAVARALDLAGNASALSEICVEVDANDELPRTPGQDAGGDGGGGDDGNGGDDGMEEVDDSDSDLDVGEPPLDGSVGGCSVSGGGRPGWGLGAMLGLLVLGWRGRRRQ